jgi:hypothetical protein
LSTRIARLAGATPAPDTSLEAIATPETVERIRQMEQGEPNELPGAVRPTPPPQPPSGRARATFEDVIGPARERLRLLQETELGEDRINEILSAQSRLKRDLTAFERSALIEVNTALDAEQERVRAIEQQREAAADLAVAIREQTEDARLLASYGGQETEQYRIHLGLLQAC